MEPFDQGDLDPKSKKFIRGSFLTLGILTLTGLTAYLVIYRPLFQQQEKYKKIQEHCRKGIDQSKIQPGDMKVWSSPYEPQKK